MFLLRLAFWLAVLVFLLPTDPQQQARLQAAATATMARVASFCDRNAKSCAVGAEVWANFVKKAEFALRLIGDLLGMRAAPGAAPPAPDARKAEPRGPPSPPDLYQPPGRRPAPDSGG